MGCVGSRYRSSRRHRAHEEAADMEDGSPTVFYVQNVDDQGAELNEGYLEVTPAKLVLRQQNGDAPIEWPLRCLRRYGFNEELFSFESGRRCTTGPGIFAFKCRRAETLFHTLQGYLQMTGQQQGGGGGNTHRGQLPATVDALTAAGNPAQQTTHHGGLLSSGQPPQQRERYMEPPQASPVSQELRPWVVEPYLRPLSIRGSNAVPAPPHANPSCTPPGHVYMNGIKPSGGHNYVNTNGAASCSAGEVPARAGAGLIATTRPAGDGVEEQQPGPVARSEICYADLDLPRSGDSPSRLQQCHYLNVGSGGSAAGGVVFLDLYGTINGTNSSSDEEEASDRGRTQSYINVPGAGQGAGGDHSGAAAAAGGGGRQQEQPTGSRAGGSVSHLNYANLDTSIPSSRLPPLGLRKVNYSVSGDSSTSEKGMAKRNADDKQYLQNYSQIDIKKTVALSTRATSPEEGTIVRKTRHDSSADDLQ